MRLILFLSIGITISSCLNSSQKSEYLSRDIDQLKERIDFVNTTFQKENQKESSSSRDYFLLDELKSMNNSFYEIEKRLKNNSSIKKQIVNINKSISRTVHSMNNNSIDDLIQLKFSQHLEELDNLKANSSENITKDELTHSIKTVQEGILNTLFTLSRTDKYTFNKVEPFPYTRNENKFNVKRGDSLDVAIFTLAYDSSYYPKITYWVDDSTFNMNNAIRHDGWQPLKLGGNPGKHTVLGKYETQPNNRKEDLLFQFSYTVD